MKELVTILESMDCERVRNYIQSGNIVFETWRKRTGKIASEICSAILRSVGFWGSVAKIALSVPKLMV